MARLKKNEVELLTKSSRMTDLKKLLERCRDFVSGAKMDTEGRCIECLSGKHKDWCEVGELLSDLDKAIAEYGEIEVKIVDETVRDSAGYNKRLMFRGQRSFHSLRLTTNEAENIASSLDGKVLIYEEKP